MRYLSVCSGIEAASVAWHHLGWTPAGFSEIEPFPAAVLAHRFPNVPNFGDLNDYKKWPIETESVDVLVGGTPCQSFSVAGLRKGLADPRGNLALVFLGLVDHLRPRFVVWENVPGVLSSNGGRDFGSFLGALSELGYGWTYRVLDAQYFGVAQRRRRVFVVGCIGGRTDRAAEVLSLAEGLSGHPAPSREARKEAAGGATGSAGSGGVEKVAPFDSVQITNKNNRSSVCFDAPSPTMLKTSTLHAVVVTAATESSVFIQREVPQAVDLQNVALGGDIAGTLDTSHPSRGGGQAVLTFAPEVAGTLGGASQSGGFRTTDLDNNGAFVSFHPTQDPISSSDGATHALTSGSKNETASVAVATFAAVRRLTPKECERLQGFPDGWSDVPWRGKPNAPDGPRYKAIGNSMAVPVMRWIGERIAAGDALLNGPLGSICG